MKRRVTLTQHANAPFDASQLELSSKSLTIRDLDALREERITLDFEEIPEQVSQKAARLLDISDANYALVYGTGPSLSPDFSRTSHPLGHRTAVQCCRAVYQQSLPRSPCILYTPKGGSNIVRHPRQSGFVEGRENEAN